MQPSWSSTAQVSDISLRRAVKPVARLSASASVAGFICGVVVVVDICKRICNGMLVREYMNKIRTADEHICLYQYTSKSTHFPVSSHDGLTSKQLG